MTTEATNTPPIETELPTVAGLLARARLELADEQYIARGVATDWLLDLLNAALRPPVRRVVLSALADFSHRNMAPAPEFFGALDRIQIALQVDAAYDEVELEVA